MVKSKNLFIIGAVLLAGIILFMIFWPTETDRVKKQFKTLAQKFEKDTAENNIVSAAKANKIIALFTRICVIHAPAYDFSREIAAKDLTPLILTTRAQYKEISLDFYDMTITFVQADTAEVILTANLTGQLITGEYVEDIHELECTLNKIEDTWYFKEIEVVEVLEK